MDNRTSSKIQTPFVSLSSREIWELKNSINHIDTLMAQNNKVANASSNMQIGLTLLVFAVAIIFLPILPNSVKTILDIIVGLLGAIFVVVALSERNKASREIHKLHSDDILAQNGKAIILGATIGLLGAILIFHARRNK